MRFETETGYQAQVDFGEFQITRPDGSVTKLYLFSMILGYSRKLYAELIERCDLPTFLDCHIHAFEYFGGVPEQILYDRMRNVYIGKIAGKQLDRIAEMRYSVTGTWEEPVIERISQPNVTEDPDDDQDDPLSDFQ